MEKIVKKLIDNALEGVDVYYYNGNIWFIFTETKEWVLELKKTGNLWYNYYFFNNLFSYLSMDVVENQKHITKYVEDTLQNGVKNTWNITINYNVSVEDTLQNGVKNTLNIKAVEYLTVEDVLQNGVKNTFVQRNYNTISVEYILQNIEKLTLHEKD